MLGARYIAVCLMVLGAVALAAPTVAVAAGGGSAGDQQYTDPFSASGTPPSSPTPTPAPAPPTSPPAPAGAPAPAATTGSPTPSPATSGGSGPTASVAPTSTTPTATTASPTPGSAARTLPYTGYDSWLAGALGLVLVGVGLGLRRHTGRA